MEEMGCKLVAFRNRCAKRLLQARDAAKLTQKQVAQRAGVHTSLVSHIERATRNMTIDTYELLLRAVNGEPVGPPEMRFRFGERVRERRIKGKWSQAELAACSGMSINYIGIVEKGSKSATLEHVERLAISLSVDPDVLLHGDNEQV